MRGSQVVRSESSSAWIVYWYDALLCRPPTRMSCTGVRKRLAPGSRASSRRSRATIRSALSSRSDSGFSVTNIDPVFRCAPPVKPTTFATPGSARTIAMKSASFCRIAWNEMLWSAWMRPMSWPVSCCGKKPLGTIT